MKYYFYNLINLISRDFPSKITPEIIISQKFLSFPFILTFSLAVGSTASSS